MAQKMILDTDLGDDIDDAIALCFAARRPEIDLLAVTTCHVCTRERGRMVAKLLSLLGSDHVPYAAGPTLPLTPVDAETRRAYASRTPLEYAFVAEEEEVRAPACDDGVELLYETICAHDGEVCLVTIGPLTNVGELFRRHPDAAGRLACIALMGGDLPGGKREYNMSADPVASGIVLDTQTPKFLGTYAVTRRVVMRQPEIDALRSSRDPVCRALVGQIDLWWPHRGQKPGPVVYDMCPIVWSFDPGRFETRTRRIGVITEGPERGRNTETETAAAVQVSVDVQERVLLDMLMQTLLTGQRPAGLSG